MVIKVYLAISIIGGHFMKHGKLWARLLAAVCVLALILPTVSTAFAASYPYETVSMDDVNLRKRANTTSQLLDKIKEGETVTVLGVSGDFYRVKVDGTTGYAMKAFIDGTDPSADKPFDPANAAEAPAGITSYPYDTVVLQNVKLRKTAEAEGKVIRMLKTGTLVKVISCSSDGFAKVKADKDTGYIVYTHINRADLPFEYVAPAPEPTPVPGSDRYQELKKGSQGTAVNALQNALAELGYLDKKTIDGKYGAQTESALKTFQKRNGLTRDGIASTELQVLLYEGTPKDFKGYRQYVKTVAPYVNAPIREGGKGDAVSRLQSRLRYLGYYDGDFTAVFDKATVAAFKMFEGKNGLNADGEASTQDQIILYSENVLGAGVVVTPTPEPTIAPPTRTLKRGDSGEDVKGVQNRLTELGYYKGKITGNYNSATEDAVEAFQKKSGLPKDGVLGPVTRTVLYGQYATPAQPTAIPLLPDAPAATEEPLTPENVVVIRSGATGEAVRKLQARLQELGYYTSRLDGAYLTEDIQAVRAFQKANGLKVDGKAGYDTQSRLYSADAVAAANNQTQALKLKYGSEGSEVANLQERLITLGYLKGSADGKFGKNTKTAVKNFQKNNKLDADGIAGQQTLEMLYSDRAKANKTETTNTESTTLRVGTISNAVADMQNRLIALGYLKGKADGNFGSQTKLALMAFQRANGLTTDGVAGPKTLAKLAAAKPAENTQNQTTTSGPAVVTASKVRYANWYNEIRDKVRKLPNATLYDFTNGISWQVNMFSFGAHADSEPITKEDTANMMRAFGGKHTWNPKPVWVVLSDGSIYIATIHNMEHGVQHNLSNDFDGHICIHFPRTQSQVESIGSYATSHQKAVELGWEATQQRIK